ncbi:kinesin-related protein 7-like [Hydractinia symbiolongicarpus]|uniref:kinesin-related protein 7-like n=1 Tax=Hydractinia symbiolongicarpus TaxID=13093 RepID=UPI00254DBF3C|nr:kinesin-related protein 7-like [Hydractinia symbiolongicarpus]
MDTEATKTDKSRVNVYVRVRPFPSKSETVTSSTLSSTKDKELIVKDEKNETRYIFDHVFDENANNADVCDVICEPLISTALSGGNGSFMVYGQTGTGKTYTVLSDDGLIPQTIEKLLNNIAKCTEFSYRVTFSYLQIYQDRIYDLLFNNQAGALILREHPQEGIIVEGLTVEEIENFQEVKNLLQIGRRKLIVAETKMVRFSSRSHALCIITVYKTKKPSQTNSYEPFDPSSTVNAETKGKLYLCDLAGSERLKKTMVSGKTLDEAKYINTSLLELGNVIHALAAPDTPHIPFRNSTLTRILKESFGGNCKANMMICVSPLQEDLKETKCSLNFGQRAMLVMKSSRLNVKSRTDSHWFKNPLSKRRKSQKIDYKSLSEYLTTKLKELESAYKQEKENLRHLRDKIMRKQLAHHLEQETSSEESTPKKEHQARRLSVLTEENSQSDTDVLLNQSLDNIAIIDDLNKTEGYSEENSNLVKQSNSFNAKNIYEKEDDVIDTNISNIDTTDISIVAEIEDYVVKMTDTSSPGLQTDFRQTMEISLQTDLLDSKDDMDNDERGTKPQTGTFVNIANLSRQNTFDNSTQTVNNDHILEIISLKTEDCSTIDGLTTVISYENDITIDKAKDHIIYSTINDTKDTAMDKETDGAIENMTGCTINDTKDVTVDVATVSMINDMTGPTMDEQTDGAIENMKDCTKDDMKYSMVDRTTCVIVDDATEGAIKDTTDDATEGAIKDTTDDATVGTIKFTTNVTMDDATGGTKNYTTNVTMDDATRGTINDTKSATIDDATFGTINDMAGPTMDKETDSAMKNLTDCTKDDIKYSIVDDTTCVAEVTTDDATDGMINDRTNFTMDDARKCTLDNATDDTMDNARYGTIKEATKVTMDGLFPITMDDARDITLDDAKGNAKVAMTNTDTTGNVHLESKKIMQVDNIKPITIGSNMDYIDGTSKITKNNEDNKDNEDIKDKMDEKYTQGHSEQTLSNNTCSFEFCSATVGNDGKTKVAKILQSPSEEYNGLCGTKRRLYDTSHAQIDSFSRRSSSGTGKMRNRVSTSSLDSEYEHFFQKDTKYAKKSLRKVKTKYEALLRQFEELASNEQADINEEFSSTKTCYDLILQFKRELEDDLLTAREQLNVEIGDEDETQERDCLTPVLFMDDSKGMINREDAKAIAGALDLESTTISLTTKPEELYEKQCIQAEDKNNNDVKIDLRNEFLTSVRSFPNEVKTLGEVSTDSNQGVMNSSSDREQNTPSIVQEGEIKTKIEVRQNTNQEEIIFEDKKRERKKEKRRENITLAAIENAEIKKELLLTKLEKIRLEAVLSCVMMNNESVDMTKEFKQLSQNSMKRLTTSRSTLSSSASCAQLPTSSSGAVHQSYTSPFKKYSYADRFPAISNNSSYGSETTSVFTPSGLTPSTSTPTVRKKKSTASITKSVQTDTVAHWLMNDGESTTDATSSEFDISSMSDISSPGLMRRMSPCGQANDDLNNIDFSMDMENLDNMLLQYRKKEKFSISCLSFFRKRQIKKRLKELEKSQFSSTKKC